jgi:hypothetical protein
MTSQQKSNSEPTTRRLVSKFRSAYVTLAILFLNTVVAYALINIALGGIIAVRHAFRAASAAANDPVTEKYGAELLDTAYPELDRQAREEMLAECWNRPYVYSDFTHFKERPWSGRYVNVTENDYRKSLDQGPWPPLAENFNIFVFGGSTTFGYGQPDDSTLPSYLQAAIKPHSTRRVCVYNFGVGWYFSTQERIRFEQLLLQGHAPHVAYFIDGVNDAEVFDGRPAFSRQMADAFNTVDAFDVQSPEASAASYFPRLAEVGFERLPIGRFAAYTRRKLGLAKSTEPASGVSGIDKVKRGGFQRMCESYLTNKQLIEQCCKVHGVIPIFVWQPVPGYKYQMKYHLFARQERVLNQGEFYTTMYEQIQKRPPDPHFIWCADIQENATECLYCDHVHYTSSFTKTLAEKIVHESLERKLLSELLQPKTD